MNPQTHVFVELSLFFISRESKSAPKLLDFIYQRSWYIQIENAQRVHCVHVLAVDASFRESQRRIRFRPGDFVKFSWAMRCSAGHGKSFLARIQVRNPQSFYVCKA